MATLLVKAQELGSDVLAGELRRPRLRRRHYVPLAYISTPTFLWNCFCASNALLIGTKQPFCVCSCLAPGQTHSASDTVANHGRTFLTETAIMCTLSGIVLCSMQPRACAVSCPVSQRLHTRRGPSGGAERAAREEMCVENDNKTIRLLDEEHLVTADRCCCSQGAQTRSGGSTDLRSKGA